MFQTCVASIDQDYKCMDRNIGKKSQRKMSKSTLKYSARGVLRKQFTEMSDLMSLDIPADLKWYIVSATEPEVLHLK